MQVRFPEGYAVSQYPGILEHHFQGILDVETRAYYILEPDYRLRRARWVEFIHGRGVSAPVQRDTEVFRFLTDMRVSYGSPGEQIEVMGFGPPFDRRIDHILRDQLGLIADPVAEDFWPKSWSYKGEIDGVSFVIVNSIWEDVPLQLKLPEFATCHPEEVEAQLGVYRRIQALFHTATRLAEKPVYTKRELVEALGVRF